MSLSGSDLGLHNGQHLFTIGQRARIGGQPHPLFVAGKDPATNTVTVVGCYDVMSCDYDII